MKGTEEQQHPLQAIMQDEGDLSLFPSKVVAMYMDGADGPLRAHALMRTLMSAEPNTARRSRQQHWLAQSRLWTHWGAPAPRLGSFNGIGTTMFGKSEFNAQDKTYVSTVYSTVAFVPVWAKGSYVVANSRAGWSVYGRAPLTQAGRRLKLGWTVGGIGGMVLMVTGVFAAGSIHSANGDCQSAVQV